MQFWCLFTLLASFSLASKLTPVHLNEFNANPLRPKVKDGPAKSPLGRMSYTHKVLQYLQQPSFREACEEHKSKQEMKLNTNIPMQTSRMSCSRAIYMTGASYYSFVPLRFASGLFCDMVRLAKTSLVEHVEFFIHFDDSILDWNIRARKGLLTYTASIRNVPDMVWELTSLVGRIQRNTSLLANFDGISLMRNGEQMEVFLLTRFETESLKNLRELNCCSPTMKFTCDSEFKVAHSRNQSISNLRVSQLKQSSKGVSWRKNPRFLVYLQPKPVKKPVSDKLVPEISVPLKQSESTPTVTRRRPSQSAEPVRRGYSTFNFGGIQNKYHKDLPAGSKLIKRVPVLPSNPIQSKQKEKEVSPVKKEPRAILVKPKQLDGLDSPTSISDIA